MMLIQISLIITYVRCLKRVTLILSLILVFTIASASQENKINEQIIIPDDSTAIELYNDFEMAQAYSYEYFEDAFALGQHFIRQDKNELARYFLELILDNRIKYPRPEQWGRLSSKSNLLLARYCENTGDIENAIYYYKKSAGDYEAYYGQDNFNIQFINSDLARLYRSIYNYEEAILYFKKNLEIADASDHEEKSVLYHDIAESYTSMDEFQIALNYADLALSEYQNKNLDNTDLLAGIYHLYGNCFEGLGNLGEALNNFKKAKDLRIEEYGPESAEVAFNDNSIGNIFLARTEYDSAMHYYSKSLKIRERTLPKNDVFLVHSYYNVGYTYSKLGFMDSALIYCDKSISSNLGVDLEDIPSIDYSAAVPISIKDLIVSLTDKAEYYYYMYNLPYGKQDLIKKSFLEVNNALEYSNQAVGKISNYYSDLSWIQFEKRLMDLMVKVYHHYDLVNNNRDNISLKASLIKKNRVHNKYFQLYHSKNNHRKPGYDLLKNSRHQLEQILSDKGISDFDLISGADNIQNEIPGGHPLYINQDQKDLNIDQIPVMIGKNQAIIDYLLSDSLLIIHAITKNRIKKYSRYIPGIEKAVEEFSSGIKKMNDISESKEKLSQYLLDSLSDCISVKELIIIPDGILFRIPFEVLCMDNNQDNCGHLIENFSILYSFSISNLLRGNKPERDSFSYDYTGWTPFGDDTLGLFLSNSADTLYAYEYLPEAKREIELICNFYIDSKGSFKSFIGKDASLENLLSNKGKSSILHFATHNFVDYESPFLSHLLLHFENDSVDKFNQLLFLPTVPYIGLKADLVILDGCETGNGKLQASEGLLSMAHAISANDVSSVVQSLWKISDRVAREFTVSFIKHYNFAGDLGNALRQVKLEFLNSPYNHPYFWAGILGYKNYIDED